VKKIKPKKLQWSRFFSKRKIARKYAGDVPVKQLQWSRFFSKRKIVSASRR